MSLLTAFQEHEKQIFAAKHFRASVVHNRYEAVFTVMRKYAPDYSGDEWAMLHNTPAHNRISGYRWYVWWDQWEPFFGLIEPLLSAPRFEAEFELTNLVSKSYVLGFDPQAVRYIGADLQGMTPQVIKWRGMP